MATYIIYPVIIAVNLRGDFTILMENPDDTAERKVDTLLNVLDGDINFPVPKDANLNYGDICHANCVITYSEHFNGETTEYDSEVNIVDLKRIDMFNASAYQ